MAALEIRIGQPRVLANGPGDEVLMETRDGGDG